MKLKIAAALTITVFSASVFAQVYQWKDANGRTVVSDTPPPGSVGSKQRASSSGQSAVAAPTPAAETKEAPKSMGERDMDFKKRQQDAKEKADKAAQEQAAATERKENCERARQTVTAMESNQPVATVNEKGERQIMDNSARQAELERAKRIMADACK